MKAGSRVAMLFWQMALTTGELEYNSLFTARVVKMGIKKTVISDKPWLVAALLSMSWFTIGDKLLPPDSDMFKFVTMVANISVIGYTIFLVLAAFFLMVFFCFKSQIRKNKVVTKVDGNYQLYYSMQFVLLCWCIFLGYYWLAGLIFYNQIIKHTLIKAVKGETNEIV